MIDCKKYECWLGFSEVCIICSRPCDKCKHAAECPDSDADPELLAGRDKIINAVHSKSVSGSHSEGTINLR